MRDLERLGRYRIVRELGRGGMGVVYQAEDEMLARTVALKTLAATDVSRTALRERLLREARLSARLDHPNVIRLYDIGSENGVEFLVMEYVEGRTLRDALGAGLRLGEALRLFRDMAAGVSHAHDLGIVHRDLKPENVMVTSDGVVKVMDFGLAWHAGQAQLTRTGAMMGTMAYFSPEQARGQGADQRSDIYSLGAILYELLTGDLVFEAMSPAEMIMHHLQTPPPRASARVPAVPEILDQVIIRCLQKDPAARYASVRALLEDLVPLLAEPVSRPRPALPSPRPENKPASPWPVAEPSAPAPALPSNGAWGSLQRMMARMQPYQDAPETPVGTPVPPPRETLVPQKPEFATTSTKGDTTSKTFDTEYRSGKVALEAGQLEAAERHLKAATVLNAREPRPYLHLAVLYTRQERLLEAVEACRAGLKLAPDHARLRAQLGTLLGRSGQTAAGLAEGEAAVKLRPDLVEVWRSLGRQYQEADRVNDAIRVFEEVLKLNARDLGALKALAALHVRQMKPERAEELARKALRLAPRDASVQVELAKALEARRQFLPAAQTLQEAVRAEPQCLAAWEQLIGLHLRTDQKMAAQTVLEDALTHHPHASPLLWLQGELQLRQGHGQHAAELFDRALDCAPEIRDALKRLNDTGADGGTLEKAVARDPSDVPSRALLGRLYLRRGQGTAAVEVLEQALLQTPSDALLHFLTGQARRQKGQTDAAVRSFKRAWELRSKR